MLNLISFWQSLNQIWNVTKHSTTFATEKETKEGNGNRSLLLYRYVSNRPTDTTNTKTGRQTAPRRAGIFLCEC